MGPNEEKKNKEETGSTLSFFNYMNNAAWQF